MNDQIYKFNPKKKWSFGKWLISISEERLKKLEQNSVFNKTQFELPLLKGRDEEYSNWVNNARFYDVVKKFTTHIYNFCKVDENRRDDLKFDCFISIGDSGAPILATIDTKSLSKYEIPLKAYFSESFLHFPMKRPILPNIFSIIKKKMKKKKITVCILDSVLRTSLSCSVAINFIKKAIYSVFRDNLDNIELEFYVFTIQGRINQLNNKIIKGHLENKNKSNTINNSSNNNRFYSHSIKDVIYTPLYLSYNDIISKNENGQENSIKNKRYKLYEGYRKTSPDFCGSINSALHSVLSQINEEGFTAKHIPTSLINPNLVYSDFEKEPILKFDNLDMKQKTKKNWRKIYNALNSPSKNLNKLKIPEITKKTIKNSLQSFDQEISDISKFLKILWKLKMKIVDFQKIKEDEKISIEQILTLDQYILNLIGKYLNTITNIRPTNLNDEKIKYILGYISQYGVMLLEAEDNREKMLNQISSLTNFINNQYHHYYENSILNRYYLKISNNKDSIKYKEFKNLTNDCYIFTGSVDKWMVLWNNDIINHYFEDLTSQNKQFEHIICDTSRELILIADRLSSITLAIYFQKFIVKKYQKRKIGENLKIHFLRKNRDFKPILENRDKWKEKTNILYMIPELRFRANVSFTLKTLFDKLIENITNIKKVPQNIYVCGLFNNESDILNADKLFKKYKLDQIFTPERSFFVWNKDKDKYNFSKLGFSENDKFKNLRNKILKDKNDPSINYHYSF